MRIRTLLSASFFATLLLVLAMGMSHWKYTQWMNDLSETLAQADETARKISSVLVLSHEYALYPEERVAQQMRESLAAVVGKLNGEPSAADSPLARILYKIPLQAATLSELFEQLEAVGKSPETPLQIRRKQLLSGQMLTNVNILSEVVQRRQESIKAKYEEASRQLHRMHLASILALVALLTALAVLLGLRVLRPLTRLHATVSAVAQGDLTAHSASRAKDELGDLSRTFDAMAIDMVSELRREVAERRQAEESLKTYAERLKNLHRIDQAILQAIDSPEKITQEAILHVRDLLHCQRVSVGMFDFEKKEVRVFAAAGDTDSVVQTGQVLPEDLYGDLGILRENRLEIIEDTSKMETVPDILGTIQAEGVRSSINAPVSSPKGLIGVLSIGWDTARTITPEEQEIVSEVASQIAIAIEQARLLHETKRHAEELEETVRLRTAAIEASNKELESFSYSVSHDLRAPLRHISGYVDLLNKRFREALPEKAGHYLSEITDSASQMGTLIDDLLQFSRTGRQELRQAEMDMNAAVQEVLENLKPDMKNRNISWTVAELPRVFGDYSLLQQVWMNLLENAVKYTRYKDEATIEVGFTREPDQWEFFVRDNGVGFDMQYAHKLFGVFQRLHSPAQFEGTGIGLANVQRIVHRQGGRVRAEGRPDEGAAFYFTIPRNTFNEGCTS